MGLFYLYKNNNKSKKNQENKKFFEKTMRIFLLK